MHLSVDRRLPIIYGYIQGNVQYYMRTVRVIIYGLSAITQIIKALSLSSSWVLYFGRGITPSKLELEEVVRLDKRSIGNLETNIYGSHYDKKTTPGSYSSYVRT